MAIKRALYFYYNSVKEAVNHGSPSFVCRKSGRAIFTGVPFKAPRGAQGSRPKSGDAVFSI